MLAKAEPTTTNRRAFIMPSYTTSPGVVPVLASDDGPVAPAHVIHPVETIADRFWFELPGRLTTCELRSSEPRPLAASSSGSTCGHAIPDGVG